MKTEGTSRTKQRKKQGQGHSSPYANYVRYMDLKKQVKARKRMRENMAAGRVEKISRIRPVDRPGDE